MVYLVLLIYLLFRGIHSVLTKTTQENYVNGFMQCIFFTVFYSLFQALQLLIVSPVYKYSFETNMLINPLLFAVFFLGSYVLFILSLKKGANSLVNIINSFSLLIPIITGLIVWNEHTTVYQIIGLAIFIVIIFLFNTSKPLPENKEIPLRSIFPNWIITALGSTVLGGIAVIFTKQHMISYGNAMLEYLLLFNIFVVILGLPYLLWAAVRNKIKFRLSKQFAINTAILALIQNINNIVYMFYITRFASASFFPLMGILNIIAVLVGSRLFLKEKITKNAYWGILLSIFAIYLLGLK